MKSQLNILYLGDLQEGGTALQRMQAFKDLGHSVCGVNKNDRYASKHNLSRIRYRINNKLFQMGLGWIGVIDLARANQTILKLANEKHWDILWLDKGLTIDEATILKFKKKTPDCKIVGYSPDDMFARHNQSKQFLEHIKHYDIYFTTKSYNVQELKQLGCPNVCFIENSFDPNTHKPKQLSMEERGHLGGQIGFIGAYEKERAKSMEYLGTHGIPVKIWGSGWSKYTPSSSNLTIKKKPLWSEHYAKAICSFDIALCFLRKINRDLQTSRSIEIPACGTFMLAERTREHQALFEEGKEAEFFGSNEELLDKVRYYLNHPEEREKIADAGRQRCVESGYSNKERLLKMLDKLNLEE